MVRYEARLILNWDCDINIYRYSSIPLNVVTVIYSLTMDLVDQCYSLIIL